VLVYTVNQRFYCQSLGRYIPQGATVYKWENMQKVCIVDAGYNGRWPIDASLDKCELTKSGRVKSISNRSYF
jgi:hypothetical protein